MKIRCYGCEQKLDVSDLEPLSELDCPVCERRLWVPMTFGDLILEQPLGAGLLTTVYRGQDLTLDREVAVKILHQQHIEAGIGDAFLQAARSMAAVSHAQLLPIYSCGTVGDEPYLLMQYMPRRGLDYGLSESDGPLPLPKLIQWFKLTVQALDAARQRDILHLDICPSNLLIDEEDNLKVADFGLSNLLLPSGPIAPDSATRVAQPPHAWYLPPERVTMGKQGLPMDIYGLGATYFHLCCGEPPYPGVSLDAVMQKRFSGPPTDPRELRRGMPDALATLLLELLRLDPEQRPSDYVEIHERLNKAADELKTRKQPGTRRVMRASVKAPLPRSPVVAAAASEETALAPEATEEEVPSALLWLWRLVPLGIAVGIFVLLMAHLLDAGWYRELVLPHLLPPE